MYIYVLNLCPNSIKQNNKKVQSKTGVAKKLINSRSRMKNDDNLNDEVGTERRSCRIILHC